MTHQPSNKFEVLTRRVINKGVLSEGEIQKNRKSILREERLKKEKKEKPVKVKKSNRRRIVERGNSKNWFRGDIYIEEKYRGCQS